MVELWCSVVSVGMVVDGRCALWCRHPLGRRSCFDPCMPGQFGVGLLLCGLFMVGLLFLQRFHWCMVVLAALWSACSPLLLLRYSRRRRSRMLSMQSSRPFLGFVVAGLSDVVFILLPTECAWRVALVLCSQSRNWSACLGLRCGSHGPGRLRWVAVGRPLHSFFPVGYVLLRLAHVWRVWL